MSLNDLAGIAAKSIFGGVEKEGPHIAEQVATAVGSGDSGTGSTIGSTAGGFAGSVIGSLFGPAGTAIGGAVGSAAGGQLGTLAENSHNVPAGPGATIESGTVDTGSVGKDAALSVAQSMQHLAMRRISKYTSGQWKRKELLKMAWPTQIGLYNSEHSHTYDGSEVRETWYIEPFDSVTAFISAMLGQVDDDGTRRIPAPHYLYPWCLATGCEIVPFDPRSFSYMGAANLTPFGGNGNDDNLKRINIATKTYKGTGSNLDPTVDNPFMSANNADMSAGAFITVTYLPALSPVSPSAPTGGGLSTPSLDVMNLQLTQKTRTNVINSGLRLITAPTVINAFGAWYPSAGVAPIMKEEYQELRIDRRMLKPSWDLSVLSQYMNDVNTGPEKLSDIPNIKFPLTFVAETLRFQGYSTEYVQVPIVDDNGEPSGWNRWLNLTLKWDWRTTLSDVVHGNDGNIATSHTGNLTDNVITPVTWNHILAHPGTLTAILTKSSGLGWYKAKYFSRTFIVPTADPYPLVTDAVGAGAKILDPLTINP